MRNIFIFDLDGTLTDTLLDLALSTNHALRLMGYEERSVDEVRRFVGNGIHRLIERAVPAGTATEDVERCFEAFRQHYVVHCMDHTSPYDGVVDVMRALQGKGVRMAIVSNKLQAGVDEICSRWFADLAEVCVGERQGIPRKPAPDMVEYALKCMGAKPSEAIYIGDSEVDIQTAKAATLPCVSVLWGFRDKDFLLTHGATHFATCPHDLLSFAKD